MVEQHVSLHGLSTGLTQTSDKTAFGGLTRAVYAWRYLVPYQPLSLLRGQAVAIVATMVAGLVRWAMTPLIGGDVSFITAAPAVLIATLMGGRLAAATALVAGSAFELLFSSVTGGESFGQAAPRVVIWLFCALFIMVVALQLRAAMSGLSRREQELVSAGAKLELLIQELAHRGRNALAVVQAVSMDTARSASSVHEYQERLSARLSALAASYGTLTNPAEESIDLSALVDAVTAPFSQQIWIDAGPACEVGRDAGVPLSLVLHELATNASKYGALSTPRGEVIISWSLDGPGSFDIRWTERGGPPATEDPVEGFGSQLLRRALAGIAGGALRVFRRPEGMAFEITLPCAHPQKSSER